MTRRKRPVARTTTSIGGVAIVAIGGLVFAECSRDDRQPAQETAHADSAVRVARDISMSADQIRHGGVRWGGVGEATGAESVDVPGRLVPDEDRTARLSAPVEGRLVGIAVRVGDRVARGQSLATLQSQEASAARADFAKATADLHARDTAASFAQTAYERAERLLDLKAMSRQDVDRARVERESALATRSQAQAELERARATLDQLGVDSETGMLIVRTPLAGIVLTRDAVPGGIVGAGSALLTVTDPEALWLDISATEALAASLRPGSAVRFTVQELADETFSALIQGVGGALDPSTRTLHVRAVVHNASGRLRPEMFATVRVEQSVARVAVSVPDEAIQLLDERPVVFVARPDGTGGARLERRDVEVGARVNGRTQMLRGLAATDVVVTDGAFAVKSRICPLQDADRRRSRSAMIDRLLSLSLQFRVAVIVTTLLLVVAGALGVLAHQRRRLSRI